MADDLLLAIRRAKAITARGSGGRRGSIDAHHELAKYLLDAEAAALAVTASADGAGPLPPRAGGSPRPHELSLDAHDDVQLPWDFCAVFAIRSAPGKTFTRDDLLHVFNAPGKVRAIKHQLRAEDVERVWALELDPSVTECTAQEFVLLQIRIITTILGQLASLETYCFYSRDRDQIYVKIRADLADLEIEAAKTNFHLRFRSTVDAENPFNGCAPYAAFTLDKSKAALFEPYRAVGSGMTSPFRAVDRIKLMDHRMDTVVNFNQLVEDGVCEAFFPLPQERDLHKLSSTWLRYGPFKCCGCATDQPLDEIRDYFGEEIAFYFAFLEFYCERLIQPALLGLAAQIWWVLENFVLADAVVPAKGIGSGVFAVVIAIWSTLLLEHWKRRQAELQLRWGMSEFKKTEVDRPQYWGEVVPSPVIGTVRPDGTWVGKKVMFYNPARRSRKELSAAVTCVSIIALVVGGVIGTMVLKSTMQSLEAWSAYAGLGAGMLNFVLIQVFNWTYSKLALWLTNWENWRTDSEYTYNLYTKLTLFRFVNTFFSFFWLAFFRRFWSDGCTGACRAVALRVPYSVAKCPNMLHFLGLAVPSNFSAPESTMCDAPAFTPGCGFDTFANVSKAAGGAAKIWTQQPELYAEFEGSCMGDLQVQIATIFGLNLIVGNFQELVVPGIKRRLTQWREGRAVRQANAAHKLGGGLGRVRDEDVDGDVEVGGTPANSGTVELRSLSRHETAGAKQQKGMRTHLTQAEKEMVKDDFDVNDDWSEIFVQFGFVTLFVVAVPVAPLLALLNNYVEVRVDAAKLCQNSRRPMPKGAADIGIWYHNINLLSRIAVITNALMFAHTTDFMRAQSSNVRWAVFGAFVGFVLVLQQIIDVCLPDEPEWVQLARLRHESLIKSLLHGIDVLEEDLGELAIAEEVVDHAIHADDRTEEDLQRRLGPGLPLVYEGKASSGGDDAASATRSSRKTTGVATSTTARSSAQVQIEMQSVNTNTDNKDNEGDSSGSSSSSDDEDDVPQEPQTPQTTQESSSRHRHHRNDNDRSSSHHHHHHGGGGDHHSSHHHHHDHHGSSSSSSRRRKEKKKEKKRDSTQQKKTSKRQHQKHRRV